MVTQFTLPKDFSPEQIDVILNEERTTEQERRAIHEGKFIETKKRKF